MDEYDNDDDAPEHVYPTGDLVIDRAEQLLRMALVVHTIKEPKAKRIVLEVMDKMNQGMRTPPRGELQSIDGGRLN